MALCSACAFLLLLVPLAHSEEIAPALTAQGHFEAHGRRVPVTEVFERLDSNGDGGLSPSELQGGTWRHFVEEVALGLAGGVVAAENALASLLERFDGDASSSLEVHEVAEAARAMAATRGQHSEGSEERQRRLLRARATASAPGVAGRRLDQVKKLVDDPRCHAPKGYPNHPEGWLCIDSVTPIYCTENQRAYEIERCSWNGECQAGRWLEGGCRYPLCEGGLSHCFNTSHFLSCSSVEAHGRWESRPLLEEVCRPSSGSSCHVFNDGIPPSRRRRTQSCHEECHKKKCHQECVDDPQDPPITTCVREGCKLLEVASPAYVRKCVSVP